MQFFDFWEQKFQILPPMLILKTNTSWLNYFSKNKMYGDQFLVKTKMLIYS